MVPETAEEIEAKMQLELLNRNQDLQPVEDIMNEDHDAYICIYRQAMDTPAKAKAIQNRLMAKMQKEKQQKQEQQQMAQAQQ